MGWLKGVADEVLGLFVDDARFALAIVLWLALIGALASAFPGFRGWLGPALFAGLVAILVVSATLASRRR